MARKGKKRNTHKNQNKLDEALKKSFISDINNTSKLSNIPDISQVTKELSDDPFGGALVVDGSNQLDYDFGLGDGGLDKHAYQNKIINSYRDLASKSEVSNAIDIIINELIYTINDDIFKIDIDEENEKISEVINDSFKNVLNVLNIKENIFNIARQMYIDGQLNVSLAYNKNKVDQGIVSSYILDPIGLYFDKSDKRWKYTKDTDASFNSLYTVDEAHQKAEFTEAELVHVDYGLYSKVTQENQYPFLVNLGYLENAFKNANLLETLENMLVPMRYSRSVSRRLFNIDVADLPPKQAKELMDKIRAEFRYKKTYDVKNGTIKNIKNTQPLVEDYWMSNRGGSKGTTVDTMDEKGAAMDLEDIRYAAAKLYTSLKIPEELNPYSEERASFSFDDTEVSQSFLKFYIFVARLRVPITKLIKETLRRELVAKGIFKDSEWKNYEEKININFTADSMFVTNMKRETFLKSIDVFQNMKDSIGEVISLQTAVREAFDWSTEQLTEELKQIEEEKLNPLFKAFYNRDEENDSNPGWR